MKFSFCLLICFTYLDHNNVSDSLAGLGTSSILAGAIMAALWRVAGKSFNTEALVHAVSTIIDLIHKSHNAPLPHLTITRTPDILPSGHWPETVTNAHVSARFR